MKRLLTNLGLIILGLLLLSTVGVAGVLFNLIYGIIKWNKQTTITYWANVFRELALGIDRIGCVLLGTFLTKTMIKTEDIPFGKIDHTISHVLALNYQADNLTKEGKALVWLLELVDEGHITEFFNPTKIT